MNAQPGQADSGSSDVASEVKSTKRVSPAPRMARHENHVHGVEKTIDRHEPQQDHDQLPQRPELGGVLPAAWPMRNHVGHRQVEDRHRTHVDHGQHKAVQVGAGGQVGPIAASCWPTSVETARPMPIIGTQATLLTLKASMVAAWATLPRPPTSMIKRVKEPHSTSHCRPPGAAVGPEPPHEVAA